MSDFKKVFMIKVDHIFIIIFADTKLITFS